ncbi:hypothetical protein [Bradyrhizobium sp. WSM1743]|uniref:hypothetical protein n=1 Tax=Bradyrhizobium sp. WSM1743 TaxID=318996 RepID=UPI000488FCEA|nr:hypothetical protein [Bradyrhizobium sp. WSM1743]
MSAYAGLKSARHWRRSPPLGRAKLSSLVGRDWSSSRLYETGEDHKAISRDGGTHRFIKRMQTRVEIQAMIGLRDDEALALMNEILSPCEDREQLDSGCRLAANRQSRG